MSDWYSAPGPDASAAQNNIVNGWYDYAQGTTDVSLTLGQATDHAGVYYIAVSQQRQAANYSLVVTYTPHTLLASGSVYVSAAPLVAPAPLYLEHSQAGSTTQTVQLTLITEDVAEFGSFYANVASHNNPNSVTNVSAPHTTAAVLICVCSAACVAHSRCTINC